jgi:hypothetical protein
METMSRHDLFFTGMAVGAVTMWILIGLWYLAGRLT